MSLSKPFNGAFRKLVLAFDVGTTFSGIAYTILDPGEVPKIQAVTRFPAQANGDFKIPSVLWYTQNGEVRAAGAEAELDEFRLEAEDDNLVRVEFKLHLRPSHGKSSRSKDDVAPPLPLGKTVLDVFADFLGYLFSCAKTFITETHANGASLWQSVEDRIEFVLSHPNGWEGPQQAQMRQAAVDAKLVPDTPDGYSHVHFVTEGEASLHYCLDSGLAVESINVDSSILIIDAGGGTVDLSTYVFESISPITVEEAAAPACIFQGSTKVNIRAKRYIENKLKGSSFGNEEDISAMIQKFEKTAKPVFKDPKDRSYIQFGTMRDNDKNVGIRSGQLILPGDDVAQFFEPSINAILDALRAQLAESFIPIQFAFLVGGFAASPYLYARLKKLLQKDNIELCRPDNHTNKAVAEGAISFHLQNFVSVRVMKTTYGSECSVAFDESDPEHRQRRGKVGMTASGRRVIPDAFSVLLEKGRRVRDKEEVSVPFAMETPLSLKHIFCDIMSYRGKTKNPRWMDSEPEAYITLCTVKADISGLVIVPMFGNNGRLSFRQHFKIVLLCGLTELKAQICWDEDGVEKRGPASVVYDVEAIM
ncbi:hypothetical protein C8Q75DRAFT_836734 [Abortiporus biennis]|nr:hypothetical protein C8Q75DRAFT_836734 [Abortiporus biennis]